ncbi:2-amino-4-hydroxy-6-hydroxymethyldihydropteridine diphosphokinase [Hymenobacter arizonensis]|uniref:2-amino-4-hydroxy-6-hydroxymethyldihydropteridine pyrophosphokinase n=1 Tax=Hymenobacter arizonensis TaxID=1227077 RepID=A0A1I5Z9J5_HYMAR|nr:2-amino-4-hydroxy-6-hydroxymethyldihydropteridine diphosphokinase [Hymenobacter arizonensis]SFQ53151.1 2-amino-4-hydroxy-6-hydroxymethyldihydropteridinediphosphokinase [Hymenobacter arizonensis]
MSAAVTAYLLLGSNLGDRAALLRAAQQQLATTAGEIIAASALYETAAWGREDQPAFLNQALAIRTTLPPELLLAQCLAAERHAGRERLERWGSRTLDVDILLYGPEIIDQPSLTVPHPRLAERRFALVPLAEIAPELEHPQAGLTVTELLARCPDPLPVRAWLDAAGE